MSSLYAEVEERGSLYMLLVGKFRWQPNKETERGQNGDIKIFSENVVQMSGGTDCGP